jgi:hypothetical protein
MAAALLLLAETAASAASLAQQSVPFSALGYQDDLVVRGPNPRFDVYIPEYPQLRTLHLRAPLRVSPAVDKRSTITVRIGDVPVYTATIASLGTHPVIDIPLPIPKTPEPSIPVEISANLFVTGDICFDLSTDDLYLVVGHDATITAGVADLPAKPFITDFLNQYDGRVNVVVPRDAPEDRKLEVARLAYYLHQVTRWRSLDLTLSETPDPSARNIIVRDGGSDLTTSGRNLIASYAGVDLIRKQLSRFLLTDVVTDAKYDAQAMGLPAKTVTLDDLGLTTQTTTGLGELHFSVPLDMSSLGGVPQNLTLHLNMTHTPLSSDDRAFVNVIVNDTLIKSYDLHSAGGEDDFDFAVPAIDLLAANDIRIEPNYFPKRDACRGSIPKMTATLLNETSFHWDSVQHNVANVGDFLKVASGRVVVSVADPALIPQTFRLLDRLGAINSAITTLDIRTGSDVPTGYDYAIVVGPPQVLAALKMPVQLDGRNFTLIDRSSKSTVFNGDFAQPFGVLEVGAGGNEPVLAASYFRDPAALSGIDRLDPVFLAAQTDDIVVFNRERASYSSTTVRRREIAESHSIMTSYVPLGIGFVVLALAVTGIASRRRRPDPDDQE